MTRTARRNRVRRVLAAVAAAIIALAVIGIWVPLRSDEVGSLRVVSYSWSGMMQELRGDVHPPLFFILFKIWVSMMGTSEIGLRSMAALVYVAAAVCVFAAARSLWGLRSGVAAAAVFATSPLALYVAHFARMYTLLALFATFSTWAYVRIAVRGDRSRRTLALYAAANCIGSFVHIWFFFLIAAQVLCAFRRTVIPAAVSVVPYAVLWAPVLLDQVRTSREAISWIAKPTAIDMLHVIAVHGGAFLLLAPAIIYFARKRGSLKAPSGVGLLAAVWMLTLAIPFAVSFWRPLFYTRFTAVALPPFALAVGAFAAQVSRLQMEKALIAFSVGFLLLVEVARSPRCDPRWSADYLAENARPGDLVLFTNISREPVDYYWNRVQPGRAVLERSFPGDTDRHPGFETVLSAAAKPALEAEARSLIAEAASAGRRVFLLHTARPLPEGVLIRLLDAAFTRRSILCVTCEQAPNDTGQITVWDPKSQVASTR